MQIFLKHHVECILGTLLFIGLYFASLHSYLLFHSLAEIISIVVGVSVFLMIWNSRQMIDNTYYLILGTAYLFVSGLDLLHVFAFKGMNVFSSFDLNLAPQLWIASRYLESIATVIAPLAAFRKQPIPVRWITVGYLVFFVLTMLAIFWWKIFPACFIEGEGLTTFKIVSEYIICLIFIVGLRLMYHYHHFFSKKVFSWLVASILLAIGQELWFTLYSDMYGLTNLLGHYFKVASFYCFYKAMIQTSLSQPLETLFTKLHDEVRQRKETETELRKQERFLRLVIDSIPQWIFWKDTQNTYLGCNQRVAQVNDLDTPYAILGKTDFDLCWHESANDFQESDHRVIESGMSEYRLSEKWIIKGTAHFVEANRIPLRDADGKIVGILGVCEDATERKRAEADLLQANLALSRFKATLDITLDALFIIDAESLRFIYVNQGAVRQVGYSREEFLEMTLLDIKPTFDEHTFRAVVMLLVQGTKSLLVYETAHKCKEGSLLSVEVSLQYVQVPGQRACFVKIARDIRERKEFLARLEEAKAKAETANRAKSAFLANMSHELRTPLNGILGFVQLLNRDSTLTPEQRESIAIIQRSGEYLLSLITDILDISKIEADRLILHPTRFYLESFLHSIIELFEMRAQQKRIVFIYERLSELPTIVYADEKRFRQILINLLSNAIKFTENGRVSLKVDYQHNKIHFQVEDTGIGIPPEDLDKIFLPFHQLGEKHYQSQGTGLGLAITKRLVELMGGEITVESTPGQGSKFCVSLELTVIETSDTTMTYDNHTTKTVVGYTWLDPAIQNTQIKVLVVDDKLENRLILTQFLTPLGFLVAESYDGQEALNKARDWHPQVVFLDLVMPVMDGFATARAMRQIPELKETIIFAVSASVFDFHKQESIAAGCNDFIAKPFRLETLIERLQTYLPLQWIYEESLTSQNTITPEEYPRDVQSSREHLMTLENLAKIGDIQGILDYTQQMEQSQPELSYFLREINQLAKGFKKKQILNLIRKYNELNHE